MLVSYQAETGFSAAVNSPSGSHVEVRFESPQSAVTPGQACVFSQGDRVLGGATIARASAPRADEARDGARAEEPLRA